MDGGDGRAEWFPLVERMPLAADAEGEFLLGRTSREEDDARPREHIPRRRAEPGQGVRRAGFRCWPRRGRGRLIESLHKFLNCIDMLRRVGRRSIQALLKEA